MKEFLFDIEAVWVLANAALTRMAFGVRRRLVRVLVAPTARSYGLGAGVGFEEGLGGLEVGGRHVIASVH